MDDTWAKYAEAFSSPENPVLDELARDCYANYESQSMLSGYLQGRILSMLSKMIRPRRVLEVGTYLGYSAMCLAEGLAEDGKVITLDIDEKTNAVARAYVARSAHSSRIDFRLGPAIDIIPGLDETFDLVFIDADKPNYAAYYDLAFPKVREGGFLIADNVLWKGKVVEPESTHDSHTRALHEFNKKVRADGRVSHVLLPVRDGLMVVRKERG